MELRKIIAILMALTLAFALCACGGDSESSADSSAASSEASSEAEKSIVGKYMIYSMEDNGETIDYNTIVMIELDDSYIEFRADKTFTMALSGEEPDNGTYDVEKSEIYDDEGMGISFEWKDDKVIITYAENSFITFVKEGSELFKKDESSAEETSPEVSDESSEAASEDTSEDTSAVVGDLAGKFMLYSMTAEGTTMDYEMLKMIGMDVAYVEIDGESFEMNMGDGDAVTGTIDTENKKFVGPDDEAIPYTVDGDKVIIGVGDASMVFVKEGSDLLTSADTSTDTSDESTDAPVEGGIYGKYICVGESYTGDNYSEPYTPSYVILNEGGKGTFCSNTTEMDLSWSLDGENFTGTVTAFGEIAMNGTLKDGMLEVIYGDGFYMQFDKNAEGDATEPETSEPVDNVDGGIENYVGDWHGMLMFDECTGDYENNNEVTAEMVARILVDENGNIVPFLAVALGEDTVTKNFKNVEMAHYTEDGFDFMMMRGEFYGLPISFESYIEADGEVLNIHVKSEDEEGNALAFYGCLRHLDDEWDKENDYMYFPDDMYDFYYGKTLEEIVELYGLKATDLPK